MTVVAVTTNSSVERSTREAAESSSLHGPELHPLAASVTIILSEPLLVAMMHLVGLAQLPRLMVLQLLFRPVLLRLVVLAVVRLPRRSHLIYLMAARAL